MFPFTIYFGTALLGVLLYFLLNEDIRNVSKKRLHRIIDCFSYYTFSWYSSTVKLGPDSGLENLGLLDEELSTTNTYALFKSEWRNRVTDYNNNIGNNQTKRTNPSLVYTLYAIFGQTFRGALCLTLIADCLEFAKPYLLSWLIKELSDPTASSSSLFIYSILIFLDMEALSFLDNAHMDVMCRVGMRVQSCLISAVYEKMLYLSCAERQKRSLGEIVNLMSNDIENFQTLTPELQQFVSGPLKIILTLVHLYILMGSSAIPGIFIILLFLPMNTICSEKLKVYLQEQKRLKDERIRGINEILTNMQTIKVNVLEDVMYKKIDILREKELTLTRSSLYLKLIVDSYNISAPFVVPLVSFGTLAYKNGIDSIGLDVILVCMTLFKQIKGPLQRLANLFNLTTRVVVSNERLYSFLTAGELQPVIEHHSLTDEVLVIDGLKARWPSNSQFTLTVDKLVLKTGQMISVTGKVGSGKTSFLSSILGVMEKSSGHCNLNGSVGYVSQQAWIENVTVKENILFGSPFVTEKYSKVVHSCGLDVDLDEMTEHDSTVVGHQGSNLSGGQKSRVSLARALYQECDLYLLDDPLAAIDTRVSDHIINKLFGRDGLLKNKTVIIVTHNEKLVKLANTILEVRDGSVKVKNRADIYKFNHHIINNATSSKATTEKQADRLNTQPSADIIKRIPKLKQHSSPFLLYVKSARQWHWIVFFSLFLFFNYVQYLGSLQITTLANNVSDPTSYYQLIVFGIFQLILFVVSSCALIWCSNAASQNLHQSLLKSILNGKMIKIGTQLGEIANTCSKDIDSVDVSIPPNIKNITICFLQVFITLMGVFKISSTFILILIPLGIFYYSIVKVYIPASTYFRTMMSASKSKIYYHFSESINGVTTISAFHKEQEYMRQSASKVDTYIEWKYSNVLCNRWLTIRLDLIGSLLVFLTAFGALVAKWMGVNPNTAVIGVCLTYGINLTDVLSFALKELCGLQSKIHSVERIYNLCQLFDDEPTQIRRKVSWPTKGTIEFESFFARYHSDQDYVLKNINVKILPGEKVGIVGRTGSGKSSFIMSILKMVDETIGNIKIDEVNIRNLSSKQLRGSITVISQNPIMFSGSIRNNIDPFGKHNDKDIWQALSSVQMDDVIKQLPGKLDHDCSRGSDLSVGQKQLLALAGALLKNNKILILDEATSALDDKTEQLIQSTIDHYFGDYTILSIAHKLKSVENCDRVVLIDNGQVVRDSSPKEIIEDLTDTSGEIRLSTCN